MSDQAIHLMIIYFATKDLIVSGLFDAEIIARLVVILTILKPTSIFIEEVLADIDYPNDSSNSSSIALEKTSKNSSRVLGYVERLFVLFSVIAGEYQIIMAWIALKGVGRFREIQDNKLSGSKFVVGTGISILVSGLIACILWHK